MLRQIYVRNGRRVFVDPRYRLLRPVNTFHCRLRGEAIRKILLRRMTKLFYTPSIRRAVRRVVRHAVGAARTSWTDDARSSRHPGSALRRRHEIDGFATSPGPDRWRDLRLAARTHARPRARRPEPARMSREQPRCRPRISAREFQRRLRHRGALHVDRAKRKRSGGVRRHRHVGRLHVPECRDRNGDGTRHDARFVRDVPRCAAEFDDLPGAELHDRRGQRRDVLVRGELPREHRGARLPARQSQRPR